MNEKLRSADVRDEIRNAIAEMLFLSESEAPLELLPPDPKLTSQEAFAASLGPDKTMYGTETFLEQIRHSIDPNDDGLKSYLAQWESLFALLKSHTADICIYRSGADPVTITIASIIGNEALLIRTTAVET